MKKLSSRIVRSIIVCCLLAVLASVGTVALAAEGPTAYIRGALRKETADLRAGELLEVATEGFKANADLRYVYSISTTSSKPAKLQTFASADMYNDRNAVNDIATGETSTSKKSKCAYFALPDKWSSFGTTEYGDFDKVTVTVTVTDQNNPGDTASCSYTGFKAADLKADVDGIIFILFKGQSQKLTTLYGLNGVVHITCENSHTVNGTVTDTKVASYSNDSKELSAVGAGVTDMTVTVYKESGCAYHRGQRAENVKNTVYVVDLPVENDDGSFTFKNVPVGVSITVNGVTKTSAAGAQDLTFTGLTANTEYPIEASVTDSDSKITATADTRKKTSARYAVTVNSTPAGYGSAAANYTSCKSGTKIVITPTPTNADYAVDSISYKKSGSSTVYTVSKDGDGNYSFTMPDKNVTVTVTFKQVVFHPETVTVTPESGEKYIGETLQLTATVGPENTTNKAVTWSSSDDSVATVDENGLVTMLAAGTATITATSQDDDTKSDSAAITVLKKVNGFTTQPSIENWTYGDDPAVPSGVAKGGTLVYTYEGRDGTTYGPSTTPPTQAGDYNLVVDVAETTEYQKIETVRIPFSIAKRPVVVSGISAMDKTYDGNTDATLDYTNVQLNGLVEGDDLQVSAKGAFADANVGEKTVNLSGLTLSGEDVSNYILDDAAKQQQSTKASILAKQHNDAHDNSQPAGDRNPGDFKASVESISDKTYTGSAITPDNEIVVKDEDGNVIPASQYDVTYTDNKDVGTANVKITFKNNYAGELNTTFDIVPKQHNDAHDNSQPAGDRNPGDFKASVESISDKTYTGEAITPDSEIVVKDEDGNVIPASQYDVTYTDNKDVGTANVKITFKNNYAGELNTTFDIVPKQHNDAHDNSQPAGDRNPGDFKASVESISDKTYTGSAITPDNEIVVKDEDGNVIPASQYDVTYTDNKDAGTAKVKITFKNNYAGELNTTFSIAKRPIVVSGISAMNKAYDGTTDATLDYTNVQLDGLAEGDDLQVSAKGTFADANVGGKTVSLSNLALSGEDLNNYVLDDAAKQQQRTRAIIFAKQHRDEHDNSQPAGRDNPGDFKASVESISDKIYTGSAITVDSEIVVKDENGDVIPASQYDVTYTDNVNAGTANVKITFKNNYAGELNTTFDILPREHNDAHDNSQPAGDQNPGDFKATVEKMPDVVFTGSPLTPKPIVKDGDKVLEEGKDYQITGYENNCEIGTATVYIEFIGNYSGRTSANFQIVEKAPKTGDNSSMSLWIALMFISGSAFVGASVYDRKRRAE